MCVEPNVLGKDAGLKVIQDCQSKTTLVLSSLWTCAPINKLDRVDSTILAQLYSSHHSLQLALCEIRIQTFEDDEKLIFGDQSAAICVILLESCLDIVDWGHILLYFLKSGAADCEETLSVL